MAQSEPKSEFGAAPDDARFSGVMRSFAEYIANSDCAMVGETWAVAAPNAIGADGAIRCTAPGSIGCR